MAGVLWRPRNPSLYPILLKCPDLSFFTLRMSELPSCITEIPFTNMYKMDLPAIDVFWASCTPASSVLMMNITKAACEWHRMEMNSLNIKYHVRDAYRFYDVDLCGRPVYIFRRNLPAMGSDITYRDSFPINGSSCRPSGEWRTWECHVTAVTWRAGWSLTWRPWRGGHAGVSRDVAAMAGCHVTWRSCRGVTWRGDHVGVSRDGRGVAGRLGCHVTAMISSTDSHAGKMLVPCRRQGPCLAWLGAARDWACVVPSFIHSFTHLFHHSFN